jgi:Uma2 family endonuclease
MSERAVHRMTDDEFLEWDEFQEDRHELVDGMPVAMAGAKRRHDQIVVNTIVSIGGQLGSGQCRVCTADTAVRIPAGNVRRPDVSIDCGTFDDNAAAAEAPTVVIEVLSPSTREFDMFVKLDEYKTVESLTHIILIDPDTPQVIHWARAPGAAWTIQEIEGLDAQVALTELHVTLPLAVIYAGLTFHPRPRLIADDDLANA